MKGGDIRRSWWPGCRAVSPNPPVWKCCIQKPNFTNVTIDTCHKMLGTSLSNGKKIFFCIPRSFFFVINICDQGKTLCSPCTVTRAPLRSTTLSHKQYDFREEKILFIKCVLRYSAQFLCEIFLIKRKIQRDTAINVRRSPCKVPVILVSF